MFMFAFTSTLLVTLLVSVSGFKLNDLVVGPVIRGVTPPIGNSPIFDKNVVAKGFDISFLREAELKHGRLAMLAAVILPTLELVDKTPSIYQFQHLPENAQVFFVSLMYLGEFASMLRGWEHPSVKLFALKPDYQPGDLGFQLWNRTDVRKMDVELNNGRLAMIGVLGIIAQELVTNQPIF